jgi:hypothetical protein
VTDTATKHANKSFLSWLGGFSLGVDGWLWIEWVIGFGWFEFFLFFMVVGARNKLRSTLLTLILTSLKLNTQSFCGFGILFGSMEKLTIERDTCFTRRR